MAYNALYGIFDFYCIGYLKYENILIFWFLKSWHDVCLVGFFVGNKKATSKSGLFWLVGC